MSEFRFDFVALRRILVLISIPLVAFVLAGVVGARDGRTTDSTLRELRIFSEVLQLTGRNYVDDLELRQLERGAYRGLAESLDPWSSLHDDRRLADLARGDRSAGIGLLLLKHPQQYVRVVVVVPGSPADQAGVKAAQWVETIDGVATKNLALLEAEAMLAGPPGTEVKLGFFRDSDAEAGRVVSVPRRALSDLRVVERRLDAATALLRLTDLEPGARDLMASRLDALRKAGIRNLVLDLRANVGGSPEEAVAVADLLAPPGPVFQRVTRTGSSVVATRDDATWEGELVVLVERGTVGEAELLAEALRQLRGAKLIGRPTLGKRTQQDLVRLGDGLGLSLSVAEYRRPDGSEFDAGGLEPDETVNRGVREVPAPGSEPGDGDVGEPADGELEPGEPEAPEPEPAPAAGAPDAQLERALELLREAAAAAAPAPKAA